MTNERIEELRKHADRFNVQLLHEALDEVERLRAIGLEAVKVLDRARIVTNFRALIGESPARDFDPLGPADQLPADVLADVETERGMLQIERKP